MPDKTRSMLMNAIVWCRAHPGRGAMIMLANEPAPITLVYAPDKGGWFKNGYLVQPNDNKLLYGKEEL